MSNVNLAIGGRSFTVACANGEESHVAALGRMVDAKVTASGAIAQNETRMLLFAALILADEVHETRADMARVAQDALGAQTQDDAATAEMQARIDAISRRLEALADDLEAQHLEDPAAIT
jgi:cell division protein ZapA